MDLDPDPSILGINLQDANRKQIFLKKLPVLLHHFSKIKSQKEVTKQQESGFTNYTFA
jgi:hypothetical protein